MTDLPAAPGTLEDATAEAFCFGRIETGRAHGEEWVRYVWEGAALADAQGRHVFTHVVERLREFRHRALAAPHLALDAHGAQVGLAYRLLDGPSEGVRTLDQYAAFYDGTMLNVYVTDFLRKLCDAVLAVHRYLRRFGTGDAGHGLLVPAMVLVLRDHSPRISGLGLAHALHQTEPALTRHFADEIEQTPFLAPETRTGLGHPADPLADIFSVGALVHYAASNHTPGEHDGPLADLNLNVNPHTSAIVARCLHHKPASRYRNVDELLRSLDISADEEGRALAANIPFARVDALISAEARAAADYSDAAAMVGATKPSLLAGAPALEFNPEVVLCFAGSGAPAVMAPNSALEPRLSLVQAGPFVRGNDRGGPDEQPSHVCNLDAFYLAQTTVTAEQFLQFLDDVGGGEEHLRENPYSLLRTRLLSGRYKLLKGAERLPANTVTWAGAKAYAAWLAKKTGLEYRLPTEAEWERAAKGAWSPRPHAFPWGDADPTPLTACFGRHWEGDPLEMLLPVDALPRSASAEGVLQLAGSVWEWCEDLYDARVYKTARPVNPRAHDKGTTRVLRGGCWSSGPHDLRCSARRGEVPRIASNPAVGVRLALSVPPQWLERDSVGARLATVALDTGGDAGPIPAPDLPDGA